MNQEFVRRAGGEFYRRSESISSQTFLEDNASPEAHELRREWEVNRRQKRQILTVACSDSRVVPLEPTREIQIRAVAAGINPEDFLPALSNPNVIATNLMGHHSGYNLKREEPPSGCTGLGIRKELIGKEPASDIEKWLLEHVEDADPLLHLFGLGQKVFKSTGKEILLSSQDHLDKTVYPLAAFLHRPVTPVSIDFNNFTPEEAYANGIPHLTSEQLQGSSFADYLLKYFQDRFPSFHNWSETDTFSQMEQNPRIYLITTNIRPAQVCYPHLSEKPGDMFITTLPRKKNISGDKIEISDDAIDNVVCQAEVPINHFSGLSTILIETGAMEQSLRIAERLKQKGWFVPWIERQVSQVFIGQTRRGVLEQLGSMPKFS